MYSRAHEQRETDYSDGNSARRLIGNPDLSVAAKLDDAWLNRVELREAEDVYEVLRSNGFEDQLGSIAAVFVDRRCGFIACEVISGAIADPDQGAAHVLRLASSRQASGVFLAVNDVSGSMLRGARYRDLVARLKRKGELIDVYLLDQFVLTGGRWYRARAQKGAR
jgi:DNA repair protein RadC